MPTLSHRILLCSLLLTLTSSIAWAADVKSPCAEPAFRAFDFWAGTWDVYDVGGQTKVASAHIDPILDGCVLREDYQQSDGHLGQSFTMYDATRHVWHQSWVTNRGELLEIEGTVQDGSIVLSGEDRDAGTLVRGSGDWNTATSVRLLTLLPIRARPGSRGSISSSAPRAILQQTHRNPKTLKP